MVQIVNIRDLALDTINALDESVSIDQGKRFKELEREILPKMTDAYEMGGNKRTHLGASVIGDECLRKIWLKFRKFKQEKFDGSKIRLFNRGHLEEGRIIANLECANIHVDYIDHEREDRQYGGLIGWFGSSIDGLTRDTKEYPKELIILEFKTMSDKRFNDFVNYGIKEKFTSYYKQAIVNIENMNRQYNYNIDKVLLLAVNKNNDKLFGEYIKADKKEAERLIDLANTLATSEEIPSLLKPSSAYFPCNMCEYKDICFNGAEANKCCRTCQICYRDNNGEKCVFLNECNYSEECYIPVKVN